MKKVAQKFMRDNMQQNIQKQMKALYPNFEFEHQFLRLPVYPKIILYSNVASVDHFISQYILIDSGSSPSLSSSTLNHLAKVMRSSLDKLQVNWCTLNKIISQMELLCKVSLSIPHKHYFLISI